MAPPPGSELQPVRWVSRSDAAAFCAWAGGRLPHDWEWQLAAQGVEDQRAFPWGADWDNGSHVPAVVYGEKAPAPAEVGAHPHGASPFGAQDLVGNVWQWTDAFADAHTTRALLRGGSRYQPGTAKASYWYFAHQVRGPSDSRTSAKTH
jgi:formylglycine-generating enzyme required for sulfatase activity